MFTGLVEALGTVRAIHSEGAGRNLTIAEPTIAADLPLGASVAINGVCLTVVEVADTSFHFQVGPETLRLTNLGELKTGDRVNLERSLRLGDRLGGHLVQGHVDGLGQLDRRELEGEWEMLRFRCGLELTRQMVRKGSIAVDGVSLTLVDVGPDFFSVALIPHTLAVTTLGFKKPGDTVNLETDLFAKYIGKYLDQLSLQPREERSETLG
jgi:riboflavin synthase